MCANFQLFPQKFLTGKYAFLFYLHYVHNTILNQFPKSSKPYNAFNRVLTTQPSLSLYFTLYTNRICFAILRHGWNMNILQGSTQQKTSSIILLCFRNGPQYICRAFSIYIFPSKDYHGSFMALAFSSNRC